MKTIMTADGRMAATSPRGAFFCIWATLLVLIARTDSPRVAVPVVVNTGARMPGSFGCDDDDEEEAEVDALILGIRKLGVKEGRD